MSENIVGILTDITPIIFYATVFFVVYVETAFLFAFFIPGDTLLFSAGLVAAVATDLNIILTCSLISVAAFLGDQTSYAIGRKYGISYITSRNKTHLDSLLNRAEDFYRKHGRATIFLSRFYPWFRTLAPFLAGVGEMRRREFMAVNLISAFSWGAGITLLGYFANSIDALKSSSRYIAAFFICATILLASKNYFEQRQIKETHSNV
jgi:membrane-associated protein